MTSWLTRTTRASASAHLLAASALLLCQLQPALVLALPLERRASQLLQPGHDSKLKVYEPTWESLDSRPTPAWWTQQKFSLFMHWGLYAVPSYCPVTDSSKTCYAEHFWDTSHNNGSAQQKYMARVYGPDFQYQDFAPMFTCADFEPAEWAALFKQSGAQGLTMTSKHHEGWTLWGNSRHANWNAEDTGPHRDLLQEVGDAVRAVGLRFGFYYSLLEWDRQYTNITGTSLYDPTTDYVNHTMIPDLKDLVARYHPDVLYTDGEWDYPSDHWQTKPFLTWLFNESPVRETIAINDRWGNDCRGKHGGFYVCEYGGEVAGSCIQDNPTHPWTSHEGMGKSFGYNRIDEYKDIPYFVGLLVQSVAFGGHLQLNVGPTADGRVPHPQADILKGIGAWLSVNGEAIWNTTGYPFGIKLGCTTPVAEAAPRQCYTQHVPTKTLFVITNGWPTELEFPPSTLQPTSGMLVSLLGSMRPAEHYATSSDGNSTILAVPVLGLQTLPPADVRSSAFAFKITGAAF